MWSKSNYRFVLALLFFEAVASVPSRSVPTYFENHEFSEPCDENKDISHPNESNPHYEQINAVHNLGNTNQESLIQQRNQDSYLPRSLPGYMSPTPTKRESKQVNGAVEEIFPRQIITNYFREPHAVQPLSGSPSNVNKIQAANQVIHEIGFNPTSNRETYSETREDQRQNQFHYSNEHFARGNYANPTSIAQERNFVESTQIKNENNIFENNLGASVNNAGKRQIQTALPVNGRHEISVLPNNIRELLNPILRTVQEPFLTTPFQEIHQPIYVRRELYGVPSLNAGNIGYNNPVNAEQVKLRKTHITNHGYQTFNPIINKPLAVPEKYNVQELLSSQRIRDILSSTKHRKRYLVIHPNGRVEHIDSLEPIATSHPNYILVNAGDNVPSSFKTKNIKLQSPILAPTVQPQSTSTKKEVIFDPQLQVESFANSVTGIESPFEIILQEPSVQHLSSVQVIPAESMTKTETTLVPQVSVISEIVTPEENIEKSEVTPSVEALTEIQKPAKCEADSGNEDAAQTSDAAGTTTEIIEAPNNKQNVAVTESKSNANIAQDISTGQNVQEINDENSSGKPVVWFNTSDPNFWNILTEDNENNVIYFFNVNSRPRIEKDTTRTILPDGSILEEITESIWYNEDDPVPVVTKTSKIKHPDNS